MQPGNLNTIIKIELVISLAHRNSGLYRCCTSFVNLGAIYPGREDLSSYTAEVCQGWWVGTNYSRTDVRRLLRAACQIAGLIWGVDLRVEI